MWWAEAVSLGMRWLASHFIFPTLHPVASAKCAGAGVERAAASTRGVPVVHCWQSDGLLMPQSNPQRLRWTLSGSTVGEFVYHVSSSTSLPGENQVDGLPPAPVSARRWSKFKNFKISLDKLISPYMVRSTLLHFLF